MDIRDKLKSLRRKRNLTQSEVAEQLDLSLSSYQKYERQKNSMMPSVDALIQLADFYNVSVDYLLGREPEPVDPLTALVSEHDMEKLEQKLFEKYMGLPKKTRQAFIEFVKTVSAEEQAEEQTERPTMIFHRLSINKASAGAGYYLMNDDEWTDIEVFDTDEARMADFAVKVEGDSMSPVFEDGDIVYIQLSKEVEMGSYGLFTQNGKGYIKKCGEDRLISVNEDYEDIYPKDGEIECIGRVIGIAELADE